MKFIHTSDWHLGHLLEGKHPQDKQQRSMLKQMAEMVSTHKPDAFVISGDIYDSVVPDAEAQTMFTDAIVEIHNANPGMHIFCIAGNHDSGAKHMIFHSAWESFNVHMIGNIYSNSNLEEYIHKVDGVGYFVTVPYSAARFMPEHVYTQLYDLVAARNDENLPVVLLAHTTIGKCDSTGHDLADDYQVGGIDRLPITELGNGYDYVALGHIHKQQNLDDDGRVWYSGTPIAVSFDEIMPGNTHGVRLAECNAHGGSVNVTPLEIKNEKPLVNIPVSGAGKWNDVLETFKAFPDNLPAFIRLNVAVEDYLPSGARDAAESAASHKEFTFCKINAQREQAKDADDGSSKGFTVSEMKKVDPTDVAKKWFSQLKTVADYERRVEAVINKAKEEIASGKE